LTSKRLKPINTTPERGLADKIVRILEDKKASDIRVIELIGKTVIADFFVICSGRSTAQVKALAEILDEKMEKDYGIAKRRIEGLNEGRWVAVDYGGVIVHIFHEETRAFYQLERLWV